MARGISGKEGYAIVGSSTIAEFQSWDATLNKNVQTYNSKSGGGWQKTVIGNKALSGTIGGAYDPDDPIDAQLDTDSLVALKLQQNSSKYISCQARLGELSFTVNSDSGEIETWSCSFESDGTVSFV